MAFLTTFLIASLTIPLPLLYKLKYFILFNSFFIPPPLTTLLIITLITSLTAFLTASLTTPLFLPYKHSIKYQKWRKTRRKKQLNKKIKLT